MKITMLNAFNGDSFILTFSSNQQMFNILVDGGIPRTYVPALRNQVLEISKKGQNIDLLVLTHIDYDHIGGIMKLFEDSTINKSCIKRVLYNSAFALAKEFGTTYDETRENIIRDKSNPYTSFKQAKTLEKELKNLGLLEDKVVKVGDRIEIGPAILKIISPTNDILKKLNDKWEIEKEHDVFCKALGNDYAKTIDELQREELVDKDSKLVNMSSIAFSLELPEQKILMLGDSHPDTIAEELKRLGYSKEKPFEVDYVKLSHHGSEKNISKELLEIITSSNYIISTNGTRHAHPSKKTLAHIIATQKDVSFYFNNDIYERIFNNIEYEKYGFQCYIQQKIE